MEFCKVWQFMMYAADLGNGQRLTIENVGTQTVLTWTSQSSGQQQSQQMSLSLGAWSSMPKLFKSHSSFILQIESQRTSYIRLQANGISLLSEVPLMLGSEEVLFQRVTTPSSPKMPEMKPLEPLRMGNMTMRMEPMEMSMGNMNLRFETETSSSANASTAHFCSQCGTKVQENDRFCAHCGTRLKS
ncbi:MULTISPECIES: zinc ribbon domain-containing protein [Leptolyngbya]|uniref:zinc ribbon domain-containing protein n=1 Tax=Leptolyngbya TaxID=47251 RepID=UPI00168992C6|nr:MULTISPECIES: zinc ribbon domain-containing protein [unclassified Leptolyngbya]MBD1857418.1 zinc ribbon domain-containing protein [Leptolyngbya sp. FACHB-1624]MBN8563728.1 zinc ribbon domain-containing protein [Leptolyngbya sp. UWPOB_LEPTO1]